MRHGAVSDGIAKTADLGDETGGIGDQYHPQLKRADDCVRGAVPGADRRRLRGVLEPDDEADDDADQRVDDHRHDGHHVHSHPPRLFAQHSVRSMTKRRDDHAQT